MRKLMLVPALLAVLLVGCSEKSDVTTEPGFLHQGPRASDGLSPTEYAILHNLDFSRTADMSEDFFPTDTLFAADYIYEGGECGGRIVSTKQTNYLGQTDSVSFCFPFDCGDYLIIYSPSSVGAISSRVGCEDSPVDAYDRYQGQGATSINKRPAAA